MDIKASGGAPFGEAAQAEAAWWVLRRLGQLGAEIDTANSAALQLTCLRRALP